MHSVNFKKVKPYLLAYVRNDSATAMTFHPEFTPRAAAPTPLQKDRVEAMEVDTTPVASVLPIPSPPTLPIPSVPDHFSDISSIDIARPPPPPLEDAQLSELDSDFATPAQPQKRTRGKASSSPADNTADYIPQVYDLTQKTPQFTPEAQNVVCSLARRIAASKNTEINTAVRKKLRLVLSEAPFFWNVRTPKFAKKVIYAADQEPTAQLYIPIDDLETFAQGHVKDFVKRVYMTNSATETKTPKEFRSYLMRTYLFGTGLVSVPLDCDGLQGGCSLNCTPRQS